MFEKVKVTNLKYKTNDLPSEPKDKFVLPALTAGVQNQGLNNYVPREGATILKNVISISANGANTGATFYQNKEFTVLQDAYAIEWKFSDRALTDNQYLFLASSISKTIYGNYEWTNKAGWERIKNDKISIPTQNSEIDFDFMENFISQLEAFRLSQLEAYLLVTGLKDYTLNNEENQALTDFYSGKVRWENIKVVNIFNVKNTRNILSRDVKENSGDIPYLSASRENNAVSSYIAYDEDYLDKGNCIFIGGKTFVVSYQEKDFYSNDSHNLALYLKDEKQKNKLNQLFLTTCIYKGLDYKYSWGDSISNRKIQSDVMKIPMKDTKPDYDYMALLISAVQKLVIKDVVLYADRKIAATRQVVERD